MGKKLDLQNPKTFNEKLQWLKLKVYAKSDLVCQCADKLKVRDYVKEKNHEEILNDLIAVYDKASDIDWDKLPEQFVLKTNHGCGTNIICTDKSKLDKQEAVNKLDSWMRQNFHLPYSEMQYKNIPRKIICEKYLKDKENPLPLDYKFYCFNGVAKIVMICLDRFSGHAKYYLFDNEWNLMRVNPRGYNAPEGFTVEKPDGIDKMFEIASELSKPFPFVRVDFYYVNGQIIFGEMTFTPCGCLDYNYMPDGEKLLGEMLNLKNSQE